MAETLLVMYSIADSAVAAQCLQPALCLFQLCMALMLPADLQPTVRASSASRGRMRRQQTLRQRAGLGQQAVHLMGAYLWDPLSGACSSVHDAACDLREVSATILACCYYTPPPHPYKNPRTSGGSTSAISAVPSLKPPPASRCVQHASRQRTPSP